MNCSTSRGTCRSRRQLVEHVLQRARRARSPSRPRPAPSRRLRIDPERHLGACAARAKMFSVSPTRRVFGSVRWKHWPSWPLRWARYTSASTTKSTGNEVQVAALDADQRHPARPGLAQTLQRLEEIVRTVDLVDVAGLRVTDDGAGPVDRGTACGRSCARALPNRASCGDKGDRRPRPRSNMSSVNVPR
jgi:hypothetical protein